MQSQFAGTSPQRRTERVRRQWPLPENDPRARLDTADPRREQTGGSECRLEYGGPLAGQRHEQAACGLRVECESLGLRTALLVTCASAKSRLRRSPPVRTPSAASSSAPGSAGSELASSTTRTPLLDASSCTWPSSPNPVTSVTAFGSNGRRTSAASLFSSSIDSIAASSAPAVRFRLAPPGGRSPFQALREEQDVARLCSRLRPDSLRMHGADDCEPVLRLRVADRVPSGENRARFANTLVRAGRARRREPRPGAPPGTLRLRARATAGRPSRRRRSARSSRRWRRTSRGSSTSGGRSRP